MDDVRLNRLLDAYVASPPSAVLRERVLAAAPKPRRRAVDPFWWASGAGLAAAGVAGLVFGASLYGAASGGELVLAEVEAYDEALLLEDAEDAAL